MNKSNNEDLRALAREMKWKYNYSFKSISKEIGVKPNSFYCWLNGQYELSFETEQRLKEVLQKLRK